MRRLFLAMIVTLMTAPAPAQVAEVDVELVLAVDISRSMDIEERLLQIEGYAAAFRHPDVVGAITSGLLGRIAVTYFEWAGPDQIRQIAPWTIISSAKESVAFAEVLEDNKPVGLRGTSISGALRHASRLLDDSPARGLRRVIDISGDGPNNMGERVDRVRDEILAQGIVINGLPLDLMRASGFFNIDNLDDYYEDCVTGGLGAFIIPVDDIRKFADAVRRKLVLEIAGLEPRIIPVQLSERPKTDCLIGEKRRRRWMENPF